MSLKRQASLATTRTSDYDSDDETVVGESSTSKPKPVEEGKELYYGHIEVSSAYLMTSAI
jgi:hypothetical protein